MDQKELVPLYSHTPNWIDSVWQAQCLLCKEILVALCCTDIKNTVFKGPQEGENSGARPSPGSPWALLMCMTSAPRNTARVQEGPALSGSGTCISSFVKEESFP